MNNDDIALRAEMQRIDSWLDDGERPTTHQVRWLLKTLHWQIVTRQQAEAALATMPRAAIKDAAETNECAWDTARTVLDYLDSLPPVQP